MQVARRNTLKKGVISYSPIALAAEHSAPISSEFVVTAWKWLSILGVFSAVGLLLIAYSNIGSYRAANWATVCFWGGLLLVYVPILLRLLSHGASRGERVGLVVLLIVALYMVKIIHSPFTFTFADEWVHVYNVQTILQQQALFTENPVIQASAFYPGLESVTAALTSLSGLSIFASGLVVIGVARLMLVLSLFLLFEQISKSARIAGIATALYMTHSNFLFWSAQFSYESLSFPLAMVVLLAIVFREEAASTDDFSGYTFIALTAIGAVMMTHHLTTYFLTVFFIVWAMLQHLHIHIWSVKRIESLLPRSWLTWLGITAVANDAMDESARQRRQKLEGVALFTLVASITWLVFVGTQTIAYLSPVLTQAVLSIVRIVFAEEESRQLFVSRSGYVAPTWERVVGLGSVLLSLVGLPFGLLQVWRRRYVASPFVFILALFSLGYFALLSLRFTSAAWETGNRASAYMFVGLSFVLAVGVAEIWFSQPKGWGAMLVAACFASILLMGGFIAGWSPQLRLAQPFALDVQGQQIMPEGEAVAAWTKEALGTANVFAADEANGRYLLVEGGQYTLIGRHPNITDVLQSTKLGKWQREGIQKWHLRYLLVDRRVISWNNMAGYFFNRKDTAMEQFDKAASEKFDKEAGVDRILDSGNIVIYNVGVISDAAAPR